MSTHVNSTVARFGLPVRKEGYERMTHVKPDKAIPPPGSYDLPPKKLTEIKLYQRPRKLVTHDRTSAMNNPPPGTYRPPSDFGYLPIPDRILKYSKHSTRSTTPLTGKARTPLA